MLKSKNYKIKPISDFLIVVCFHYLVYIILKYEQPIQTNELTMHINIYCEFEPFDYKKSIYHAIKTIYVMFDI